jgi:hypothetical protein
MRTGARYAGVRSPKLNLKSPSQNSPLPYIPKASACPYGDSKMQSSTPVSQPNQGSSPSKIQNQSRKAWPGNLPGNCGQFHPPPSTIQNLGKVKGISSRRRFSNLLELTHSNGPWARPRPAGSLSGPISWFSPKKDSTVLLLLMLNLAVQNRWLKCLGNAIILLCKFLSFVGDKIWIRHVGVC